MSRREQEWTKQPDKQIHVVVPIEIVIDGVSQLDVDPGSIITLRQRTLGKCPDDGTCHHRCGSWFCFRVATCEPLSDVYPNDEWPDITKGIYGNTNLTETVYGINVPTEPWGGPPVHPAIPWAVIGFLMNYGQSRAIVPR